MIREYIVNYISKKLKSVKALVIYDPEQFYVDLLPALSKQATVIDVRESVLTSREKAYDYFNNFLPKDEKASLLIYSPFPTPKDEQEKVNDPFFIFTQNKNYFPYSAGDKYEALCKSCFPNKEQQIDELFSQSIPDFDTIDALGEGNTYAKLQTITGGKSEKEILQVLMVPSAEQEALLKKDKNWKNEWKKLASLVGFKSNASTFEQVHDELWRVMLFSEFVFDLPVELPDKLKSIQVAKEGSKDLVLSLIKNIRNNKAFEDLYIEKAEQVEKQLSLSTEFKSETNLGEIVTFAFEDNTYFNHFVELIESKNLEKAAAIIKGNKDNIWPLHDNERRNFWLLAEYSLQLITFALDKPKTSKVLKELIDQYVSVSYKIDQLHRKYEMTYGQLFATNTSIEKLTNIVRKEYRNFTTKNQTIYQDLVNDNGWPVEGLDRNVQTFEKFVSPLLKSKKKVAYLLVDALRFELGKELEENLSNHFKIQVSPSCAFLPTVTKYGMASLLPQAEKHLALELVENKLEAHMNGKPLTNLQARRQYLKDILGDRCEIVSLEQIIGGHKTQPDLLVVTTNEIDTAGENLSHNALAAIQQGVQNLVRGVIRIKQLGYEQIVIATDHGFMLHPDFEAGDNVSKPIGDWPLQKTRSLAGKGAVPEHALSFSPSKIGINSTVDQYLFLKNYTVFIKNTQYFHEGLSLQENIVPIIQIAIPKKTQERRLEITLTYRGKSEGSITTLRPLIELSCYLDGELSLNPISIKLEACSQQKVVGEPVASDTVNAMTKLVEILPGKAYKIPFAMLEEFEGSFEIVASDPLSGKTYATLPLSTNYMD